MTSSTLRWRVEVSPPHSVQATGGHARDSRSGGLDGWWFEFKGYKGLEGSTGFRVSGGSRGFGEFEGSAQAEVSRLAIVAAL